MSAPPPPPPHGEAPKSTAGSSSGLPPGKYDIFIIPPHSSGSGFLYLPSLKPNTNSFAAGFASALLCVLLGKVLSPAVLLWWNSVKGAGGAGMLIFILAVGVGSWAAGRLYAESGSGQSSGGAFPNGFPNGFGGGYSGSGPDPNGGGPSPNGYAGAQNGYAGAPPPGTGPMPGAGPTPGSANGGPKTWQRGAPPPGTTRAEGDSTADGGASESARGSWERAREETKRKEDERKAREAERKAKEAERKRKEEFDEKLRQQREKETREREAREREAQARRQNEEASRESKRKDAEAEERRRKVDAEDQERRRKEAEALDNKRKERELAEKRLNEARERETREREIREKRRLDDEARAKRLKEAEARDKKRKEDEAAKRAAVEAAKRKLDEDSKPRGSTYAFSAVGEKTNPWPQGRPKTPPLRATPPSPTKRPPPPTARTYRGTDDDAHSYRPYDKKPARKNSFNSSYSHSSYAQSQSTSRTTPPPSHRAPYTTKDPNKIVIKAVYAFNNAFLKTPTSQLVAGVGSVSDGLILNITTEGLFIDDDVRGVPQREWDVKAWTMKLVEVWCPSFRQGPTGSPASARVASAQQSRVRRLWGLDKEKPATSEETDMLVDSMLSLCKNNCRLRASSSASATSSCNDSAYGSVNGDSTDRGAHQTGELKKLHVLRASIRDQEGKKYVFVISEEESWKVAFGLQKLRKGTQVRALGVSGMSANDAKMTLEHLGWGA